VASGCFEKRSIRSQILAQPKQGANRFVEIIFSKGGELPDSPFFVCDPEKKKKTGQRERERSLGNRQSTIVVRSSKREKRERETRETAGRGVVDTHWRARTAAQQSSLSLSGLGRTEL
jgi:hypothetical protein